VISSSDGGDHRLWCISSAPWVIWVARLFVCITYGRGNESELAHSVRATWERKSAGGLWNTIRGSAKSAGCAALRSLIGNC
jgi:hypothetical protein